VFVLDNNVDQALRILKKKMQREGFVREPTMSVRESRVSEAPVRSARKLARVGLA
jgi:small subunit ribosomal protein S21